MHKLVKGVNPKKSLTLYNGFLGFKEPNAASSDIHNVLKDYWHGYQGKKGCQGRDCHKLRIDATRSCDQEAICRITKFEQTWVIGKGADKGKTYTVGAKKSNDKSGLAGVSHGSVSKVSMYVGSSLIKDMYVLSNKQEISDVCLTDVNGKKKCLFNSNSTKNQKIDSKYLVTFQNTK